MHPDDRLIAFVQEELDPEDRARVGAHLEACPECRATADDFREILARLGADAGPPAIHWGRWQAELRGRMESAGLRGGGAGRRGQSWWRRHAWAGASIAAAVVIGLAALLLQPGAPSRSAPDLALLEETALAGRLDLLEQYPVIERLELLEDLEVIRQLDSLETRGEG
jgi:anti-sigma factor RsiW